MERRCGGRLISLITAVLMMLAMIPATAAAGTDDLTVSEVKLLNVDAPAAGEKPDDTYDVPEGAAYTVQEGDFKWHRVEDGAYVPMGKDEIIQSGCDYMLQVRYSLTAGASFAGDLAVPDLPGSYGNEYSSDSQEITVKYMYSVSGYDVVELIDLTGFREPEAGYRADYDLSIPAGEGYSLDTSRTSWRSEDGMMKDSDRFKSGNTYYLDLFFNASEGYGFSSVTRLSRTDNIEGTECKEDVYSATMRFLVLDAPAPGYGLSADPESIDFGEAVTGYAVPDAESFRITNIGTSSIDIRDIGKLRYFDVKQVELKDRSELFQGESFRYEVTPKEGLTPGVYRETVTVYADALRTPAGDEASAEVSVDLSFTVTAPGASADDPAGGEGVRTGDGSDMTQWLILMLAAAAGIAAVTVGASVRKRRSDRR